MKKKDLNAGRSKRRRKGDSTTPPAQGASEKTTPTTAGRSEPPGSRQGTPSAQTEQTKRPEESGARPASGAEMEPLATTAPEATRPEPLKRSATEDAPAEGPAQESSVVANVDPTTVAEPAASEKTTPAAATAADQGGAPRTGGASAQAGVPEEGAAPQDSAEEMEPPGAPAPEGTAPEPVERSDRAAEGPEQKAPAVANAGSEGGSEAAEGLEFDETMIEHVQLLANLIDGKDLSREETIQMLRRVVRQRGIASETGLDYALRQVKENPP